MGALSLERDSGAHRVEQAAFVDTCEHETAALHSLRALGRGPNADRGERAPNRGEVARLLRERARVRDDGEGVHLEAVIIIEAHGLVRANQRMQLEARLLEALATPGVARVEDGLLVLLREAVDCTEQGAEAPLVVDVLLAMRGEQEVAVFGEPLAREHVGGVNGGEVRGEYLGHGASCHEGALRSAAREGEPAARVLRVGKVHIGDNVDNPAVRLLGKALVAAAVTRLHMENGNMQALRRDGRETRVGVTQHEKRVGPNPYHQLIRTLDDVADA